MKKNLVYLVMALLFASQTAFANNIIPGLLTTGSSPANQQKLVLDLSTIGGDKVLCQIFNEEGQEIYADNFQVNDRSLKPFNLEQLPSGVYSFRLSGNTQLVKFNVQVDNKAIVYSASQDVTYKPMVVQRMNDRVDMHLLSQGKDVTIKLVNEKGEEVYQKRYNDQVTISERLNVSELDSGLYTVAVKVGEEVFYNYVTI